MFGYNINKNYRKYSLEISEKSCTEINSYWKANAAKFLLNDHHFIEAFIKPLNLQSCNHLGLLFECF